MVVNTGVAQIPVPQRTDRIDGPGSFTSMARRLDDITVVSYASSSARTAAYLAQSRSPVEGTLSYLADANVFEYWTGSTWVANVPDTWARGVEKFVYVDNYFPAGTQSYQASGTEGVITGMTLTVSMTLDRVYRVSYSAAVVDGGPGSSPTTGGAQLNIRYNNSTVVATTASPMFANGRGSILADSSTTSPGVYVERVWKCTATGPYSFSVSIQSLSTTGARVFGPQNFIIEDLGKTK